ncbi:MAG: AAA family ATPase [Actinomycetota bacterium]
MEETTQFNMRIPKSLLWDLDYIAEHRKINRNDWLRLKIAEMISNEVIRIKEITQREYAAGRISEDDYIKKMGFKPPKELRNIRESALGYQRKYMESLLQEVDAKEMFKPVKTQKKDGMKLKKFYIKKHKQFKDKKINFKDGINIIQGGCGTGKTTIFNLLKRKLFQNPEGCDLETKGKLSTDDPDLIFVDSNLDLKDMLKKSLTLPPNYLATFQKNIKEMELPYKGFTIDDKDISLWIKTGKINIGTLAAGDKIMLYFLALKTMREVMCIYDPLILDCPFAKLDKDKLEKIQKILKKMDNQIIIFTTKIKLKNFKGNLIKLDKPKSKNRKEDIRKEANEIAEGWAKITKENTYIEDKIK